MSPENPLPAIRLMSLPFVTSGFLRRPDGSLQYDGERPGFGWHAHGYFARQLWVMRADELAIVTLFKRRWRHV